MRYYYNLSLIWKLDLGRTASKVFYVVKEMVREEIILWIKAAEEDLYDAELAFNNKRWFRTAFFAQQAVEKC